MQAAPVPGDIVVGTVGERPIWGSCVVAQMKRGAKTREAAAQECASFEVLALEAEQRGLATHAEVIDETRRALVSRFVELEFEAGFRSPDQHRAEIDALVANPPPQLTQEVRVAAQALILVDSKAPADVDAKHRKVAEEIHAALANETGLSTPHIAPVAERIAKQHGVEKDLALEGPYAYVGQRTWQKVWVDALYAIPEVGRVGPVIRIEQGWVVMALVDLKPKPTTAEIEQLAFENIRARKFDEWSAGIVATRGIAIKKNPQLLDEEAKP
jgi:hypothetical protein